MRRYPQHKGDLTDLLIGDLFKDELDDVLAKVDAMRAEEPALS